MLFNSLEFIVFLPLVFMIYWLLKNKLKTQNIFLVIVSYIFYGWWDWRFLSLIAFSSAVDFFVGIGLSKTEEKTKRKLLLMTSIFVNLAFLGFFKYFNFFTESFVDAFSFFGVSFNASRLNIILPVGISFYTFQTLSYSIDVYNRKLEATKDIYNFFAYVSFFPQLVAGPIERAANLLPQFDKKREFDRTQAVDGMRQILWGFFKKIVIADNCAEYANLIFNNSPDYSGSTLVLGALFFAFQIYGDFSGYSDIAIGISRLFGFNLMRNFAFPYFSRDIAEFWRRWHISLSSWFKDYLYVPLGGSRGGTWMKVRNTFIIFAVSGFWHGANWTFIVWGILNAVYFLPLLLTSRNRDNIEIVAKGRILPGFKDLCSMLMTFGLTLFAWVFFRAENIGHAFSYISEIFSFSLFSVPDFPGIRGALRTIILVAGFVVTEWLGRDQQFALARMGFLERSRILRWTTYAFIIFLTGFFMQTEETPFIYFQF